MLDNDELINNWWLGGRIAAFSQHRIIAFSRAILSADSLILSLASGLIYYPAKFYPLASLYVSLPPMMPLTYSCIMLFSVTVFQTINLLM